MAGVTSVGNSGVSYGSATTGANSVAALQKQLATAQKNLSAEATSSDDAKTKEVKTAAYELQIQEISGEIQQLEQRQAEQAAPKNAQPQGDQAHQQAKTLHASDARAAATARRKPPQAAGNVADATDSSTYSASIITDTTIDTFA